MRNFGAVEMNLRCFTYQELVEATDDFKEELGKGAFGVVYKGAIEMGSSVLVAVKKLNSSFQDYERVQDWSECDQSNMSEESCLSTWILWWGQCC